MRCISFQGLFRAIMVLSHLREETWRVGRWPWLTTSCARVLFLTLESTNLVLRNPIDRSGRIPASATAAMAMMPTSLAMIVLIASILILNIVIRSYASTLMMSAKLQVLQIRGSLAQWSQRIAPVKRSKRTCFSPRRLLSWPYSLPTQSRSCGTSSVST